MPTRRVRPVLVLLLAPLTVCALGVGSGCYKRVIDSRGFGSSRYDIEEPYANQNSPIDEALFGKEKDPGVFGETSKYPGEYQRYNK